MSTTDRKFPEPQPFTDKARPPIALQPVDSSQVKAVGYDAETKTLAVQFKHGVGAIYHYPNVEPETHAAFMAAKSIGKFFGEHLKTLPFEKYEPVADPTKAKEQNAVQAAADGLAQTPVEA